MRFDSKKKVYIAVVITTALSVLASVVITGILFGGVPDFNSLVPSVVVPLCVAPLVSLWGYSQAHRIEVLNRRLSVLLNHDPLTLVHSRSYFFEAAENDLSSDTAVALMIDADHFKKINDTYGHPVGDRALKHFSEQISRHCRKSDVVARLGGEEFGVYMPGTDIATGQRIAERIRAAIRDNLLTEESLEISLSASIGVAQRQAGEKIDDVMQRADAALYQAKADGRNRVRSDVRSEDMSRDATLQPALA